jgi:hypothetical protein
MEPRHELVIEDRDLPVEDQALRRQRRDGLYEAGEATAMLDATPPDQADMSAVLVDDDSPAISS